MAHTIDWQNLSTAASQAHSSPAMPIYPRPQRKQALLKLPCCQKKHARLAIGISPTIWKPHFHVSWSGLWTLPLAAWNDCQSSPSYPLGNSDRTWRVSPRKYAYKQKQRIRGMLESDLRCSNCLFAGDQWVSWVHFGKKFQSSGTLLFSYKLWPTLWKCGDANVHTLCILQLVHAFLLNLHAFLLKLALLLHTRLLKFLQNLQNDARHCWDVDAQTQNGSVTGDFLKFASISPTIPNSYRLPPRNANEHALNPINQTYT